MGHTREIISSSEPSSALERPSRFLIISWIWRHSIMGASVGTSTTEDKTAKGSLAVRHVVGKAYEEDGKK
jgi:hypothetical protein